MTCWCPECGGDPSPDPPDPLTRGERMRLILHLVFVGARRSILNAWRRLFNRCELCGARRTPYNRNDIHTFGRFCRACNKTFTFAAIYEASEERIYRMIPGRRRTSKPV